MSKANKKTDAENFDFESSMQELEAIVEKIENPDHGLEESISDYEKGIDLKNKLMKKLEEAKLKIETISQKK